VVPAARRESEVILNQHFGAVESTSCFHPDAILYVTQWALSGIVRRPSTSLSPWNSTFFAVVGAEGSIIGGISDSSAIVKFV